MGQLQAVFAANLVRLQEAAGLTQAQLARRADVHPNTLGDLLRGVFKLAPPWHRIEAVVQVCLPHVPDTGPRALPQDEYERLTDLNWWRGQHFLLERHVTRDSPKARTTLLAEGPAPEVVEQTGQSTGAEDIDLEHVHDLAHKYHTDGWPECTPAYFFTEYFSMLRASGMIDDMVAYATDVRRQDRIHRLTGSYFAVVTEISAAQDAGLEHSTPDLLAAAKLAVHRTRLMRGSDHFPRKLPSVWAYLGDVDRAVAQAKSIDSPSARIDAIIEIGKVLTAKGETGRVSELVDEVEAAGYSLHQNLWFPTVDVATLLAASGDRDGAMDRAESVSGAEQKVAIWSAVAEAAAVAGKLDEARDIVERAQEVAETLNSSPSCMRVMGAVIRAMAAIGERDPAERAAQSLADPRHRTSALLDVARHRVRNGEIQRARAIVEHVESIAGSIGYRPDAVAAMSSVSVMSADMGDRTRASRIARHAMSIASSLDVTQQRIQAELTAARALSAAGDLDRAVRLIDTAVESAEALDRDVFRAEWLSASAMAAAVVGDRGRASGLAERAEQVIRTTVDPYERAITSAALLRAISSVKTPIDVRALLKDVRKAVSSINNRHNRGLALAALPKVIPNGQDHPDATSFAEDLRSLALEATDADDIERGHLYVWATQAYAAKGSLAEAVSIADSITLPLMQVRAMVPLTSALTVAENFTEATQRAQHAFNLAKSLPDMFEREHALGHAVEALSLAGLHNEAAQALALIQNLPEVFVLALAIHSIALAEAGAKQEAREKLENVDGMIRTIQQFNDRCEAQAACAHAYALAAPEQFDLAESAAYSIADATWRARALAKLAPLAPQSRQTHLIADALRMADWRTSVEALALISPPALVALVQEYEKCRRPMP